MQTIGDGFEQITWTDDPAYQNKWLTSNSTTSADLFENDETCYLNSVVCYVGQDGKLRIGIKIKGSAISWWESRVFFDNFKIEYIESAESMLNQEDLTTQEARNSLTEAISSAREAIAAGLTQESYGKHVKALNEAITAAQNATEAATRFDALVTYHDIKFMSTGDYSYEQFAGTPEFDAFKALIGEKMVPAVENLQSMDEIERLTAEINEAYNKMVATSIDVSGATLDSPADMTSMMQSPRQTGTNMPCRPTTMSSTT